MRSLSRAELAKALDNCDRRRRHAKWIHRSTVMGTQSDPKTRHGQAARDKEDSKEGRGVQ